MDVDEDDEIELDGEGIRTVTLDVKHDPDAPPKPKKKPKKPKQPTGEIPPKPPFYIEWAEGEELRRYSYDQ